MDLSSWIAAQPIDETQLGYGVESPEQQGGTWGFGQPTNNPSEPNSFLQKDAIPAWRAFREAIATRPQFDEAKARRQAQLDAGLRSIGSALEFLGRGGSAHQAPGLGGTVAAYAGMGEEVDKSRDRQLRNHLAMLEPHKDLNTVAAYLANADGDVNKAAAAMLNAQSAAGYRQQNLERQRYADAVREYIARARLGIAQQNAATQAFSAQSAHDARQQLQRERMTADKWAIETAVAQFRKQHEAAHGKGSSANLTPEEIKVGAAPYYQAFKMGARAQSDPFNPSPMDLISQYQNLNFEDGVGAADPTSVFDDDLN